MMNDAFGEIARTLNFCNSVIPARAGIRRKGRIVLENHGMKRVSKEFLRRHMGYRISRGVTLLLTMTAFFWGAAQGSFAEEVKGQSQVTKDIREWMNLNVPLKELKDREKFEMETLQNLFARYKGSALSKRAALRKTPLGKGNARKSGVSIGFRMILYGLACLLALYLLVQRRLSSPVAIGMLTGSVILFGVLFAADPQPMGSLVRLFQSMALGRFSFGETLGILLGFLGMAWIGTKLVCGWACPVGVLQELFFRIPKIDRSRIGKIPFWVSNMVRVTIFILFILILMGWIFGFQDQSLYRYFNPFKLFDWNFRVTGLLTILVIFALSVFIYRPYCMFACPFGLLSWAVQHFSLYKIRIDTKTCVDCQKCVRICPTGAAGAYLEAKDFKADCFACGRCLSVCPTGSLRFMGPGSLVPAPKRRNTQRIGSLLFYRTS
jgi:ferredoxin